MGIICRPRGHHVLNGDLAKERPLAGDSEDVALGEDADETRAVADGHGADALLEHARDRLLDGGSRRDAHHPNGHRVADCHAVPSISACNNPRKQITVTIPHLRA